MEQPMENTNRALDCRRALEALRNGVPNGEAVKMLGCSQPRAQSRFADLLAGASDQENPPSSTLGMLVSGDFGSGKSHLLTHLERIAFDEGFVCSKIAVSKETPLYDLGKVFKSAMDNGRMPGSSGRLIEELGQRLRSRQDAYASFFVWANDAKSSGLSPMFPASLMVHERSNDLELNNEIESFWAGDRIRAARVKGGLRQIGQSQSYAFSAPKVAELPPQRMRFAVELIKAAGYKGWVVLLDEIELIGPYSLLQRGRSYAEIARWLGQTGQRYPGLVTVGAVTDDFAPKVISADGKQDRDYVEPKLAGKYDALISGAVTGMRLLERECMPLSLLTDADVQRTTETLRGIYRDAYEWDAPPLPERARGASYRNRMRYNVRAAINEWDLLRLYPDAQPDTESNEFRPVYAEERDSERETSDDADGARE